MSKCTPVEMPGLRALLTYISYYIDVIRFHIKQEGLEPWASFPEGLIGDSTAVAAPCAHKVSRGPCAPGRCGQDSGGATGLGAPPCWIVLIADIASHLGS